MAGQVSVRLAANVDAYIAAMKRAEASTTGFSRSTQRNMTRVGGQMQTLGRTMSIGVTLPIAALGIASTKMAMDWESSFAQMVGLANVPATEVDHLKESVLALAGDTAQAPQELADGLYLAASAGLDSAEALEVVEMAAMAAASGMGSTATVTDLLTSVLGSYGSENITAARATDILTAAVREGKAAPDEMAQALGSVLPIAAAMGIEFEEVAGAAAFLTNAGLSTDEAVTALRGTMLALMDPTKEASKVLQEHGTSAEAVQRAIDEGGLLGALELLRDHGFAGNSEAMSDLIEDNRALVGATALLEDQSNSLNGILDATANSTGAAGDAFAVVAETDAFKMQQALTNLKVAMIEVGSIILPIAAQVGSAIADMASWFADLDPSVQGVIVAFAGLAATAGPLIFIAGSLIKNFVAIRTTMALLSPAAAGAATAFGAFAVAAAVGLAIWNILGQGHLNAGAHIDTAADSLINATSAAFGEVVAAGAAAAEVDGLTLAHEALALAISDAADEELSGALTRFNVPAGETLDVLTDLRGAVTSVGDDMGSMERQVGMLESRFGTSRYWAQLFYDTFLTGGAIAEGAFQDFADAAGISVAEVESAFADMDVLNQFAIENRQEISDMALAYLDAQVAIGGTGREAVKAAEAIAGNRREGQNAIGVYEEYVRQLTLMEPAQRDAILSSNEMTASLAGMGPEAVEAALGLGTTTGSLEDLEAELVDAGDASKVFAELLDINVNQMIQDMSGLQPGGIALPTSAIDAYSAALHAGVDPAMAYQRAMDDLHSTNLGLKEAFVDTEGSLWDLDEAGIANRETLMGYMDNILAVADAQIANGDSMEDTTAIMHENIEGMVAAAVAAGYEEHEVRELIDRMNLVPGDISTSMTLLGQQFVIDEINRVIAQQEEHGWKDGIPQELFTEITAMIDAGDAYGAHQRLLEYINDSEATVDVGIRVVNPTVRFQPGSGAGGKMIAVARGGYFDRPTWPTLIGEAGPEAVLPLGNQARMQQILGMPQVGPAVMAAMMAMGGGGGYQSAAAAGSTYVVNVHNNGRDLTPADVARAIEMSRTAA